MFKITFINNIQGVQTFEYMPIGWEGQSISLKRSDRYYGVFYEFGSDFKFMSEMKTYILAVYNEQGIEGVINVSILAFNENTETNILIFSGQMDLATMKLENITDDYNYLSTYQSEPLTINANLFPLGLAVTFANRSNTPINLNSIKNLDGETMVEYGLENISLHSKRITKESKAVEMQITTASVSAVYPVIIGNDRLAILVPYKFTQEEAKKTQSEEQFLEFAYDLNGDFNLVEDTAMIIPQEFGNYTFDLAVTYFTSDLTKIFIRGWVYIIKKKNGTGFLYTTVTPTQTDDIIQVNAIANPFGAGLLDYRAFSTKFSLQLDAGENVWAFLAFNATELKPIGFVKNTEYTYCNITQESIFPTTSSNAFFVHEALSKVLESISGLNNVLKSAYFGRENSKPRSYATGGEGSRLVITNGSQIRNLPQSKMPTMSFDDIFDSLDAVYCIGVGIEDLNNEQVFAVEGRRYFFNSSTWNTFKNVPKINITVANNYYFNNVEIGFSKWAVKGVNAQNEFATRSKWANHLRTVNNKYEKISKFVAAGDAIEEVRREQFKTDSSKGNEYDSDNFLICVSKSGQTKIIKIIDNNTLEVEPFSVLAVVGTQITIKNTLNCDGIYTITAVYSLNLGKTYLVDITPVLPNIVNQLGQYSLFTFNLTTYQSEQSQNFDNITNLNNYDSQYNLRISPFRNFERHTKILNSGMWKYLDRTWNFKEGEGNWKLSTQLNYAYGDDFNDSILHEDSDYFAEDLQTAIFIPEYIEFETPLSLEQFIDLKKNNNWYKKIAVSDRESDYILGYLVELKYNIAQRKAVFKLIRTVSEATVIPQIPSILIPEPAAPPAPQICTAILNILRRAGGLTYTPNTPIEVKFSYFLNGVPNTGIFTHSGSFASVTAWQQSLFSALKSDNSLKQNYNVFKFDDYVSIQPKTGNNGGLYNFILLNGMSLYSPGYCPLIITPINTKPTSCGILYKDTNTAATPIKQFEMTLIDPTFYGGVYFVAIDIQAFSATNKFEIIHNNTKKATSGMLAAGNYTPFDNTDVEPAYPYTSGPVQFIGDSIPIFVSPPYVYKPIPARVAEFTTDTGKSIPLTNKFMQRLWWKYTTADYLVNKKISVKVAGINDYKFLRICE